MRRSEASCLDFSNHDWIIDEAEDSYLSFEALPPESDLPAACELATTTLPRLVAVGQTVRKTGFCSLEATLLSKEWQEKDRCWILQVGSPFPEQGAFGPRAILNFYVLRQTLLLGLLPRCRFVAHHLTPSFKSCGIPTLDSFHSSTLEVMVGPPKASPPAPVRPQFLWQVWKEQLYLARGFKFIAKGFLHKVSSLRLRVVCSGCGLPGAQCPRGCPQAGPGLSAEVSCILDDATMQALVFCTDPDLSARLLRLSSLWRDLRAAVAILPSGEFHFKASERPLGTQSDGPGIWKALEALLQSPHVCRPVTLVLSSFGDDPGEAHVRNMNLRDTNGAEVTVQVPAFLRFFLVEVL